MILNEVEVVEAAAHAFQAGEEASHRVVVEDIHSPSPSAEAVFPEIPSLQPTQEAAQATEAVQMTSLQKITPEAVPELDKPVPTAVVAEQVVVFATAQQLSTPS
jgi:hypothetical protein